MDDTTTTQDPADIEQDIRRTQEEMSRTVDRIGNQLNARNIVNSLLDKFENNDVDARGLLDGARRNPLALAMIAGGAIWLISDSDAKLPSHMPKLPSLGSGKSESTQTNSTDNSYADPLHRDYLTHMDRVQMQDGEDPLAYQRRRDLARANYLMVERRHDEDETSFRQRLDDASESFRQRRQAWMDQTHRAGEAAMQSSRQAARRASELYVDNPLVGGLVAAAVGAVFGSLVPLTQTEQEQLGDLGEKAREKAGEQKDKLTEAVREKKDELLSKTEEAASGQQTQAGQQGQSAQYGQGDQQGQANQYGQAGQYGESGQSGLTGQQGLADQGQAPASGQQGTPYSTLT